MILKADYAAHVDFVAPARRAKQIWRLLAGLSLAVCVYMVLSRIYFETIYTFAGSEAIALHEQLSVGNTPLAMFLLLGSFAFMALAAGVSVRVLHRRPMLSLLGPIPILIRDFRAVSLVVLVVFVFWEKEFYYWLRVLWFYFRMLLLIGGVYCFYNEYYEYYCYYYYLYNTFNYHYYTYHP